MQEETRLTKKERRALRKQEKAKERKKSERLNFLKRLGLWGGALALIIGVVFGLAKFFEPSEIAQEVVLGVSVSEADHIYGSLEAKAVLVEYSCFECPACAAYSPMIHKLASEYEDDLAIVFRYFPLTQTHPNAENAALAAEAAGRQGKFWEMHNKLFETQASWSGERDPKDKFLEYARELELNIEKFEADLGSQEVKDRVQADVISGNHAKINATPTFFINGVKLQNIRGYNDLSEKIREVISSD